MSCCFRKSTPATISATVRPNFERRPPDDSQRPAPRERGVVATHQAHEPLVEQLAGADPRPFDRSTVGHDHEVELAAGEQLAAVAVVVAHLQIDAGGLRRDALEQAGQHHEADIVRQRQHEATLRGRGVEARGASDGTLHRGQRLAQRRGHRLGPRGGDQTTRAADQQGIAEGATQPCERVTGGRLRQPDAPRRRGHATREQQRVEHDQRVEVESAELHGVHVVHDQHALYKSRPETTIDPSRGARGAQPRPRGAVP